jgi:hypothetical protein
MLLCVAKEAKVLAFLGVYGPFLVYGAGYTDVKSLLH